MGGGILTGLAIAGATAFAVIAAAPAPPPAMMRLCANGAIRYAPSPGEGDRSSAHAPCHALRPANDSRKLLRRSALAV